MNDTINRFLQNLPEHKSPEELDLLNELAEIIYKYKVEENYVLTEKQCDSIINQWTRVYNNTIVKADLQEMLNDNFISLAIYLNFYNNFHIYTENFIKPFRELTEKFIEENPYIIVEDIIKAKDNPYLSSQTNEEFYDSLLHLPYYKSKQVLLYLRQAGQSLLKFLDEKDKYGFVNCIESRDIDIYDVSKYTSQFSAFTNMLNSDESVITYNNITSQSADYASRLITNGDTKGLKQFILSSFWKDDLYKDKTDILESIIDNGFSALQKFCNSEEEISEKEASDIIILYHYLVALDKEDIIDSFSQINKISNEGSWETHEKILSLLEMPVIDELYKQYCSWSQNQGQTSTISSLSNVEPRDGANEKPNEYFINNKDIVNENLQSDNIEPLDSTRPNDKIKLPVGIERAKATTKASEYFNKISTEYNIIDKNDPKLDVNYLYDIWRCLMKNRNLQNTQISLDSFVYRFSGKKTNESKIMKIRWIDTHAEEGKEYKSLMYLLKYCFDVGGQPWKKMCDFFVDSKGNSILPKQTRSNYIGGMAPEFDSDYKEIRTLLKSYIVLYEKEHYQKRVKG